MKDNSLILADMIGKLLQIQSELRPGFVSEALRSNINDLHFRIDNLYREVTRTAPLSTSSSVLSKELIILAPNDASFKIFQNPIFLENANDNPLPWLKRSSGSGLRPNQSAKQSALNSTIDGRVQKNTKQSAVRQATSRRNVLSEVNANRSSSPHEAEDDSDTEVKNQALVLYQEKKKNEKYRGLARLGEQINIAGPQMMLAYRPKPSEK